MVPDGPGGPPFFEYALTARLTNDGIEAPLTKRTYGCGSRDQAVDKGLPRVMDREDAESFRDF